jgi:hypothetical protein
LLVAGVGETGESSQSQARVKPANEGDTLSTSPTRTARHSTLINPQNKAVDAPNHCQVPSRSSIHDSLNLDSRIGLACGPPPASQQHPTALPSGSPLFALSAALGYIWPSPSGYLSGESASTPDAKTPSMATAQTSPRVLGEPLVFLSSTLTACQTATLRDGDRSRRG